MAEFSAMITHELRTPLNSIVGHVQLLLDQNHHQDQCNQNKITRTTANQYGTAKSTQCKPNSINSEQNTVGISQSSGSRVTFNAYEDSPMEDKMMVFHADIGHPAHTYTQ